MIELDVSRPWVPADTLPTRSTRPPVHWLPLLLAPLVLVTATASPAPPRLEPVLAGPSSFDVVLGPDDTAFVVAEGTTVAYRVGARARPIWQLDASSTLPLVIPTDDPGLIVFYNGVVDSTTASVQVRDTKSGTVRWERAGLSMFRVAGDTLVLTDRVDPVNAVAPTVTEGALLGVDLRTGVTRWSRTLPAGIQLGYQVPDPPDGPTAAELDRDGRLQVIDLATGAQRHAVRIALAGAPGVPIVRGGLVVVQQASAAESRIVAGYDLATGTQRWRLDNLPDTWPCDDRRLCVYGDNVTSVVDPTTGATLYRGQNPQVTIHGDRLLTYSQHRPGSAGAGAALFDLRTGRLIRSYGRWQVAIDDPDRGVLATQIDPEDRLLVAQLDLETGAATILGIADSLPGDIACTWGRQHIACQGMGGYRVWPITADVRPPKG